MPQIVKGHVQSASIYQSSLLGFERDQAASFGALMPDYNGGLLMVYDTTSGGINPSILYTGPPGNGSTQHIRGSRPLSPDGSGTYNRFSLGDYEATSYDGPNYDHIRFASQYSNKKGDWSTRIGDDQLH